MRTLADITVSKASLLSESGSVTFIQIFVLQIIRTSTPKKLAFDSNSYLYWHQFLKHNSGES
jgi:hypothetical protein